MRKLKKGKKFHRVAGERRAFLRNLSKELIKHGKIETTEARAKAIRPIVEKLVTIAKKQNLASRRLLSSRVQNKNLVKKLYEEIGPKYEKRLGGYLRITKSGKSRKRDGAKLAKIEFV
ncbi:MAG: 50S ribosomal protein L17 [bacterium]|nr:50S ribosomal protein L17 [bacterium]